VLLYIYYSLQAQQGVTPGNTKKIYVLFLSTSISIEHNKGISFDILKDTLKVYLSVAFLKTQKVFLLVFVEDTLTEMYIV